jgi:cytochrome b561/polyisoprenoid-binding protein YceI
VAILLHWAIAAAIVFQIVLGLRMGRETGATQFAIFQLHKSVGITVLLLSLVRAAWRLTHRPPPLPAHMPVWEKIAAKATHGAFYAIMLGLPLTGWALVSASPTQIPTLLFHTIPWPHLPVLPHLPLAAKKVWSADLGVSHSLLAWLTCGLLALHVAAALKHQLIDKDKVMGEMLPGLRPGVLLDPRLWAAPAVLLAVIAIGAVYTPARSIAVAAPPPPPPVATAAASPPPIVSSAPAESAKAPEAAPAAAAASHWIVSKQSALTFTADWAGMPIDGKFARWTADIVFSPDALSASHIKATVDIASITTGDDSRDSMLPTADWFDATRFPKAVFTANTFEKAGPDRYLARGTLQLRDVKAPFPFTFVLHIAGDTAVATADATLDRTKFGVGQGTWAATDQIAAAVKLHMDIKATKAT